MQLAAFLHSLALGKRRVSYVLRPGRAGEMLAQEVRIVEGVKVKVEAGVADGGMVRKENSVSMRDHKCGLEWMADRVRCLCQVGLGLCHMMG